MSRHTRLAVRFGSVVVALAASTVLADGIRDAGAKMRGEFGGTSRPSARRSVTNYRAPATTRVMPRESVAQIPTERRSFSVEPNASTGDSPSATTAQQQGTVRRSYSYDPTPVYRTPSRRWTNSNPSYMRGGPKMTGEFGGR